MHTFFIAPTGFGVGLTSISLGLLRALERAGLKVGFFKPIAQLHPGDLGPERSSELVARTHGLDTPKPLPLAQVERMLGDGQLDELLEEIISLYQRAAADKDVVIVEGMVPTRHASYAARVNFHLAKSLDAEVILVSAPENETLTELTDRIEIQAQLFGGPRDPKVLGVILNIAQIASARTELAQAEINLSRTLIHSPISGLVGQRSARNGQYVQVGTHLLSLVPDEDIWVQANFKETQVGRMRDGQKARLTFDAFPDTPIDGRIDSLFAASGAQFSLLPPDNATGNFTKVVQRIPVKIVFEADNPLHGRIRPGMSVEAEVELRDR